MKDFQMSLTNKPDVRHCQLHFSKHISQLLFSHEITHVALTDFSHLLFTKESHHSRYEGIVSYNKKSKALTASVSSRCVVKSIAEYLELGEGLHYINLNLRHKAAHCLLFDINDVERTLIYEDVQEQEECAEVIPVKSCSLSDFSDRDLYDELKRRGYEGTLSKVIKME